MKTQRTPVFALLAASATLWPSLLAQTTPAPASPAKPKEETEEVLVLSPFEVKAEEETGYVASETLAGSRIRTDLKDVASAISVITKQFMQDIGATDNGTLLQYTTNAEVAGTRGTYAGLGNGTSVDETGNLRAPSGAQRVRGLASADNTRDFFVTDIPWTSYNVDRVDIQRGPNSILFGLGSPAGIVNASLNNAMFRNKGSAEYRLGSYGTQRASVDLNQVLIKDVLAVRLDGLWSSEKYEQRQAFQDDKRLYAAIRFDPQLFRDPSFRTSLKVKYENGDIKANRPRTTPPQDSITPWFRPVNLDPGTLTGGMGKAIVPNGYVLGSSASTFNPWLGGLVNQQQPLWFIDGTSGQNYRIYGGVVNTGALNSAGIPQGVATGIMGLRYSDVFSTIGSLSGYANNARLNNYEFGQYRNASLQDETVFDFYKNLIDGPTKREWEGWNAYNIDLSQTGWGDRAGIQLTYDRQKYHRGGEALLGNPTLNLDILENFQDYVVGPNNTANYNGSKVYVQTAAGATPSNPTGGGVANANFGRPYVAGGPGRGNSYESDRKYVRGSLYAELRARDYLDNEFLTKLLGRHRFNGVYSDETYYTENRSWQMTANSQAYASFKLQGNPDAITNLPPVAVIYLGPSLAAASSASGAYIPGIQSPVQLQDGNIYQFDMTWRPTAATTAAAATAGVPAYSLPWDVPSVFGMSYNGQDQAIFNGSPFPQPNGAANPQLTQASNPANYVGWNSTFHNSLLRYNDGADQSLVTAAAKTIRVTKSYAGSWQAFLWNDAIVPTFGWRFDEVKATGATANTLGTAARSALNLNPAVYKLPDTYKTNEIAKDHSTAGGIVLHVNKLFPGDKDPLPINVSVSYNESNNFQVTDLRRDIFGGIIPNPTGETKEYGLLLSTKDGKYSFRATKYDTLYTGANTSLNNSGIYGAIRDALNWRNIKVYYMSGYDWSTANQTNTAHFSGVRYMWDPNWVNSAGRPVAAGSAATGPSGSTLETQAQADIRRDASIKAINDMQIWLAGKGYFTAWNYGAGPTTQAALQTRSQYESAPSAALVTSSIFDYRGAPLMQGFQVTADTQSKGYEFELTANPLPNWRVAFNASKTEAVRTNVGGPVLEEMVNYLDTLMAGPGGDMIMFNSDYSAANQLRFGYAGWRGQYTLLKLQENAAASELRKWRYNVVTNYSFREGFLKGVGVGLSYRWQDKVVIGYPVVPTGGGLGSFDLTKPYYGPAEGAADAWISYERKINDRIGWKIQANVRNLGDSDSLIPISVQPDGRTWASVRTQPIQEWFVTNTFTF